MNSPIIPPHPLDHPGSIKILLGLEASEALAAAGEHFLMQATRSPAHGGRFVLIALPLDKPALDDAAAVALGKARAVKIKPVATSSPSIPTAGNLLD